MFIFTKVNLSSGIVCRYFIGAFLKQFLKPFGLDHLEAFLLSSSPDVFQDFFFFLYISTDNFALLAFSIAIPIQMPKFPPFLYALVG